MALLSAADVHAVADFRVPAFRVDGRVLLCLGARPAASWMQRAVQSIYTLNHKKT